MVYKLNQSFLWFLSALFTMTIGFLLAAHYFTAGFDWVYTVASALMSQKHNPKGSFWFSASMSLTMLLLWPYVSSLKQRFISNPSYKGNKLIIMLRIGLISGTLLGLERLLIYDLSHWFYKAHEYIALSTFVGLYVGILGLLFRSLTQKWQQETRFQRLVLLVVILLIVVSICLLWLYLTQRELGWVDASWREKGIPFWLSFAFWQWWMIGLLWLGLGMLNYVTTNRKSRSNRT